MSEARPRSPQWLSAARDGDRERARSRAVHALPRTAQHGAAPARPARTATPSTPPALVHEAYLQLIGRARRAVRGPRALLRLRRLGDAQRGGRLRAPAPGGEARRRPAPRHRPARGRRAAACASTRTLLGLDTALTRLADVDARLAQVVELRYFAGLSEAEIAALLKRSERSVRRDWQKARLFLLASLQDAEARRARPWTPNAGNACRRCSTTCSSWPAEQRSATPGDDRSATDPALAAELRELLALEGRRGPTSCRSRWSTADRATRSPAQRDRPVPAGAPARRRRHGPGLAGRRAPTACTSAASRSSCCARAWPTPACASASPASAQILARLGHRAHRAPARRRHQQRRPALPRARIRRRRADHRLLRARAASTCARACTCSCRSARRSAMRTPTWSCIAT